MEYNGELVVEDQHNEFKTSIFVPPQGNPGQEQMLTIAKTIAAFMNADGGNLWLGVRDDGSIVGINSDLAILSSPHLVANGPTRSDDGFTYVNDIDSYERKIKAIVRAYLGDFAVGYLGKFVEVNAGIKPVLLVKIQPVPKDKIVYLWKYRQNNNTYSQDIYVRRGNEKNKLEGIGRDDFVRDRYKNELRQYFENSNGSDPQAMVNEFMRLLKEQAPQIMPDAPLPAPGGYNLTKESLEIIETPRGLYFDNEYVRDVDSWRDLYLAILEALQRFDSSKFDTLPDEPYFCKHFLRHEPRRRYTGCYDTRFGSSENVRAKEKAQRKYIYEPCYTTYRLLEHFGIDPSRFLVRV